ncbi:hypothetical protein [Streptomyces sp. NPDC058614]|uniref:hypothetical protein n=1 Tax=Streptomyces sp. NPDC058614 TaxID=3346557 RepID=UPI003666DEFF
MNVARSFTRPDELIRAFEILYTGRTPRRELRNVSVAFEQREVALDVYTLLYEYLDAQSA